MTRLYLVRHGESLANAAGIYLGHTDWDLSSHGVEQAEETAEKLADVPFSAIYSSDLLRAFNTAVPHARRRGMEIINSRALREIRLGDWEGVRLEELKKFPEFNTGWHNSFGTFCPPGGESVADAAERVFRELRRIAELHDGETVLVTMHAAVIRGFWCKINRIPPSQWAERVKFPDNASYSIVDYDGEFFPRSYSL